MEVKKLLNKYSVAVLLALLTISIAAASAKVEGEGIDIPGVLLSLAIMLIFAKIGGEISERVFKQPGVLGELIAGIVISPFTPIGKLLGFYPITGSPIPISPELDLIANIGVVILLFLAGIETDIEQFMKFGIIAGIVAFGGIVLPFVFGYFTILYLYPAPTGFNLQHAALFTGAILTATSVGITARVLKDIRRLTSEEGTTILGGAVIDDVLGIIVLAIVIGITGVEGGGEVSTADIGIVILKAAIFWIALILIGVKLATQIAKALSMFKTPGALMVVAIVFGLVISYLADKIGLATIIGAYAAGLALSASAHKELLIREITPIYHFLVPIFFVAMGMLVNPYSIPDIGMLGLIIIFLAIIGKAVGCGITAYLGGFNIHGAIRVGVGMVPRGEVGLIVAYYGYKFGVIHQDIYVVGVLMSVITTLVTPPLLKIAFVKGPEKGWKEKKAKEE
ncbi:MAG: cation:proton antiporter [Methanosarcinales archaeon]